MPARAPAVPPARPRASISTEPSATRRSAPATSARSSAATTASCPGAVYTKGFLRNYALYLGLDPDEILVQWRRERGDGGAQSEPAINVPRPLVRAAPGASRSRSGSSWRLRSCVVVVLFVGYLVLQLVRFSRPPDIAVTDPTTAVSTVDETATSYTLRGTSVPGATVSITVAGRQQPVLTTASASGTWSSRRRAPPGQEPVQRQRHRPADVEERPNARSTSSSRSPFPEVLAPTLTVDQPGEGATFENGAIPVQGTTANAKTVTVSAAFTGGETAHRDEAGRRPRLRRRRRPPTSATTARSTSRSS